MGRSPLITGEILLQFVDLANALITSHIAGNYASYMSEFWRLPVETEIDLSQGRWPLSRVNPDFVLQWNFSER